MSKEVIQRIIEDLESADVLLGYHLGLNHPVRIDLRHLIDGYKRKLSE